MLRLHIEWMDWKGKGADEGAEGKWGPLDLHLEVKDLGLVV